MANTKTRMVILLEPALATEVRVKAAMEGVTTSKVIAAAIQDFLKKKAVKPRSA